MVKTQKQKKVLILHTGGTIAMGIPMTPDRDFIRTMAKSVPELAGLAKIEIQALSHKDSSQITPKDWQALGQVITRQNDDYDAFVVTHGTDTMAYTGTALSYLLPYPCKPVIFTGSQRPLRELRSDARRNLINSVALAVGQRICEVSIFFDTLLLRANRAKKIHIEEYHTFDSPNFPPLAEERFKTVFAKTTRESLNRPTLEPLFDTRIQIVKVFPGADVALQPKARAVVIEAFGCGNLPMTDSSVLALLKTCVRKKVPVVLTSQVQSGSLSPDIYDMGRRALELRAISSRDMTFEAALVKCMLLTGNDVGFDDWPVAIAANWAGEITPSV